MLMSQVITSSIVNLLRLESLDLDVSLRRNLETFLLNVRKEILFYRKITIYSEFN